VVHLLDEKFLITPRANATAKRLNISLEGVSGSGPNGRIIEQDVLHFSMIGKDETHNITPLAKKIVTIEKIDLNPIQGTGIHGKITSADVLIHVNQDKTNETKNVPFNGIRKLIAHRMSQSKRTAPHVTLTVKTEVTKLVKYRTLLNGQGNETKVSYTDLLVKFVAESLRQHQLINVSLKEDELIYHNDINIGVAVALEEGLVVPIIQSADKKSVAQIAHDVKQKVGRARSGKLKSHDLENGRFTISNLGMYEVDAFTPVINLPESAILGVGRIIEDIIVQNEQIRIGKTMVLSLSFDHRVMDGVPAAMFLGKLKQFIENPEEILMLEV
jgi:pyruvate dehydrogenase E2 component (dihydrolipoamide acetyltransferase)